MDPIEDLRRTTRWRLWIRGTQTAVPAFAATFAFGLLASGHVPNAVGIAVVLAGMAAFLVGFVMTAASLPVLMYQYSSLFNGLQSAVLRAFFKDLFRLHKPPPLAEPTWPPAMWHGTEALPSPAAGADLTDSRSGREEASGG